MTNGAICLERQTHSQVVVVYCIFREMCQAIQVLVQVTCILIRLNLAIYSGVVVFLISILFFDKAVILNSEGLYPKIQRWSLLLHIYCYLKDVALMLDLAWYLLAK
ncbi:hypothetical protein CLU79DRAFT_850587 [Phycomyces nitens]|nr:hypothetical protein CLU79DRAFT_850587 [Phycomyces nitens]